MLTEMELTLEQTQQGVSYEVSMEILLEPTSNKLMVGDLCDSIQIKLVTTGMKRCEIVTHRFTLIVLSALRRSDNETCIIFDESNTLVVDPHGFEGYSNQKRANDKDGGEEFTNPLSIKEEFYKFYKSKFKSFDYSFDASSNPMFTSLCPKDVTLLQQKATLEEIRKAVWDCGCDNIVNFVNEFMESGTMPKGTNSAFITLIPKIPNPLLIKDYRPISLIGMQYKIVAKLLANRLSTALDKLVSPTQSTFISGFQILDRPLMVSEIIEWYRKRNKCLLIFKVDFEKAFNTVS
ncbi:RNA-directed DNA polymerase, eukaryota, reverse transcriptase zinc-binding domain protein [Tanacetum coccineum]